MQNIIAILSHGRQPMDNQNKGYITITFQNELQTSS